MRDEKRRERHEAIAAAAYEALAEHGYGGASMLRVAKAARASNETLYRAFRLDWMSVRLAENIMASSVQEASSRSQYRPEFEPIKREDLIPFLFD